jgi:hypothetical protein
MNRKLVQRVLCAIFFLTASELAYATCYKAAPGEINQLPKFCLEQYCVAQGPQYRIEGCGVAMNHYCPGLIYLNDAMKTIQDKNKKISLLERAKGAIEYTVAGMKSYPGCPIRKHVMQNLAFVDMMIQMYGK